jgi:hypothetical protein
MSAGQSSKPMDIGDRMTALVEKLQEEGIGGVTFPDIESECSGQWSADYAIVRNAYCPYVLSDDHDYFDHPRLLFDFKKFVEEWFSGDDSVTVVLHNIPDGSNEIEVYRKRTRLDSPG